MGKANERRAEQRLCYRWPVRFTTSGKKEPCSGGIVDASSNGMAFLCHAGRGCPKLGQIVTANFGVPHFDSNDSFDTTFFKRTGRICRVDRLSGRVNRVVIQFSEPLFFGPGEQNISESDARKRLESKARSMLETRVKSEVYGEALAKAEEKVRICSEALARAEERMRFFEDAKAQAEEKLKAEVEARYKAEAELMTEVQEKIRAYAEARARAEERANIEALARAEAEAKARTEAKARAKAEKQAREEAEKYAGTIAEQMARVRTEAAEEIARIRAEAAEEIARFRAGFEVRSAAGNGIEVRDKARHKAKAGQSADGLLKKVDEFVTDKTRFF